MGTLTGAQIEFEVRSILPEAQSDRITSAQILRLINAAYLDDVSVRYNPLELRNAVSSYATTLSNSTFTPSITDCYKFIAMQNAAGQVLEELTPEIESRAAIPTGTGAAIGGISGSPTHYIRLGNAAYTTLSFRLFPIPDAAYTMTVYYLKRPTELTVSTATAIDTLWDQVIVQYAAARVAAYIRLWEDSANLRRYADLLAQNTAGALALAETHQDEAATAGEA